MSNKTVFGVLYPTNPSSRPWLPLPAELRQQGLLETLPPVTQKTARILEKGDKRSFVHVCARDLQHIKSSLALSVVTKSCREDWQEMWSLWSKKISPDPMGLWKFDTYLRRAHKHSNVVPETRAVVLDLTEHARDTPEERRDHQYEAHPDPMVSRTKTAIHRLLDQPPEYMNDPCKQKLQDAGRNSRHRLRALAWEAMVSHLPSGVTQVVIIDTIHEATLGESLALQIASSNTKTRVLLERNMALHWETNETREVSGGRLPPSRSLNGLLINKKREAQVITGPDGKRIKTNYQGEEALRRWIELENMTG